MDNHQVLNAILYMAEQGCKWRVLPHEFGPWHTVYTRLLRGSRKGVLTRLFEEMQTQRRIAVKITAVCLDSTRVNAHPDAAGALKKNGPQSIGQSRGGRNTESHRVAADDRTALTFSLSPGQAHDDPEGRNLLVKWQTTRQDAGVPMWMDRAYEGDERRKAVRRLGLEPVVPPKRNRKKPWTYDEMLYKRRNEIERLFRRLKAYRRVFTRYDKLDRVFTTFIAIALAREMMTCVNTP